MNSLSRRLRRLLRGALPVFVGVSFAALTPVVALAQNPGGLDALAQQVAALTGQVNTNTGDISTLKATVAQQQQEITDLQNALAAESAARKQGDAGTLASANQYTDGSSASAVSAANAYTDSQVTAEQNRAEAAEQNLQSQVANLGGGSDDDSATLAAANAYTDSQVGGEATRAKSAEAGLQGGITNEASRAMAAESGLQSQLTAEVSRAKAAEAAAVKTAVSTMEANLTTLAQTYNSADQFWFAIANGLWP